MTSFNYKTKNGASLRGKPRVYFTCHPEDFPAHFGNISSDILEACDCVIYYTEDMSSAFSDAEKETDLGSMNLFIVPVTRKLLTEPCRAMSVDIAFAKDKNIPILPFMMEDGLDSLYSAHENFEERQYLSPMGEDTTAIGYEKKLKKYLDNLLITDELTKDVRAAFDGYIFLSYRKKDRKYANDLMRMIHKNSKFCNYAIWFDEFLTPGESYRENIFEAMGKSKLFLLTVTPSVLENVDGKPNFVMASEYPAAKSEGMKILAIQMAETDRNEFCEKFPGIPECLDPSDEKRLEDALSSALFDGDYAKKEYDAEREYLIGMAYLHGIDAEICSETAIGKIKNAAEHGHLEAMLTLYKVYTYGIGANIDHRSAAYWGELAVKRCGELYGELNPNTAGALNALADTYTVLGDKKRVAELRGKIYEIYANLLGDGHVQTLYAMESLAYSYYDIGEYRGFIAIGEPLYKLYCGKLGEAHPRISGLIERLCAVYSKLGIGEKELEYTEKIYNVRSALYGEEDESTLTALNNLAVTLAEQGKSERALELGRRLYELNCRIYGELQEETVASLVFVMDMLGELGERENEALMGERLHRIYCKLYGEDDMTTLINHRSLAITYFQMGEYVKACEELKRIFVMFRDRYGIENPETVKTYDILKRAEDVIRRALGE